MLLLLLLLFFFFFDNLLIQLLKKKNTFDEIYGIISCLRKINHRNRKMFK